MFYSYPEAIPIPETAPIAPINTYGHTKAAVVEILTELHSIGPDFWRIARLRYYNPVGAYPSGRIGENPLGIPNNLFPFVSQVAVGRRAQLQVFGGDWPTPDGTGVSDIHVWLSQRTTVPLLTACWRKHRNCSSSTWAAVRDSPS